ncbi:adenylate/guanylate cyclase domain-containing protein [Ancylobacter amanitiformis]|uniref:Adenylate cyclase n=1 Tax=Ancylobacter amanitiformis TaxID=217069 RepID=A0ABU0LSW3_9HYPH|nr:adenylate/guanylate cyclase domain-containing protein [Ancylobacter amanitiformis]MDQ0511793.1 adenylate cyclase [Ancylobacter amanitiformis]
MSLSSTTRPAEDAGHKRTHLRDVPWACGARQWSGIILFAFVLTHLLNHAVGVFGVEAMQHVQQWRWLIWQSLPGTLLLYGAALAHMGLTAYRVTLRRTWRMPRDEAWQIMSGLAIPLLVVSHVVQTRIAHTWFGVDTGYQAVLYKLWPGAVFSQSLLLVVAWSHGVIGMHHAMRYQNWYTARWRTAGLVLAVLIPCLALMGFFAGGREAALGAAPEALTAAQAGRLAMAGGTLYWGVAGFVAAFAGLIGVFYIRRRVGATVTITYRGFGRVEVPRGTSVLEASRINHIPHPSSCRGRGRCATCRVQVLSGSEHVTEPFGGERMVLASLGAPENIRLACQLRPTQDLGVRILMPVLGRRFDVDQDEAAMEWALEREATILVLDLRAFTTLTHNRLPYEIAVLVNRFSSEMRQAVESHGGRVDQMYGDGLMAVFDTSDKKSTGARAALRAARDMSRVLELLNGEMRGALPIPIRAGIGIHTGRVVLARVSDGLGANELHAIGDTVAVAAALESASKEFLSDYVVSKEAAEASGFDFSRLTAREVTMDISGASISVYAIADAATLGEVMAGKAVLGILNMARA